jgi:predicted nucleotidyltransferase
LGAAGILEAAAPEEAGKQIMPLKQHFEPFIDDLKSTHGRNLISVILYGSAAAGDFIPERSDYNILIALERITPRDLRDAHACIREWHKLGHPIPVYFTVDELQNAADVFPIEFHQMQDVRKVLYGKDVLAELEIHDDFLRHQIEYELRSKILRLRREYIPASLSVDSLLKLMANSLPNVAALFRAVLIYKGLNAPDAKQEILAMTTDVLNIDGAPFAKILQIRTGNLAEVPDESEANELFGSYLHEIEKVVSIINEPIGVK